MGDAPNLPIDSAGRAALLSVPMTNRIILVVCARMGKAV